MPAFPKGMSSVDSRPSPAVYVASTVPFTLVEELGLSSCDELQGGQGFLDSEGLYGLGLRGAPQNAGAKGGFHHFI